MKGVYPPFGDKLPTNSNSPSLTGTAKNHQQYGIVHQMVMFSDPDAAGVKGLLSLLSPLRAG
jgi:hypothetical protein